MDYPCSLGYIYILDDGLLFDNMYFVHKFLNKDQHIFDLHKLDFGHIQR